MKYETLFVWCCYDSFMIFLWLQVVVVQKLKFNMKPSFDVYKCWNLKFTPEGTFQFSFCTDCTTHSHIVSFEDYFFPIISWLSIRRGLEVLHEMAKTTTGLDRLVIFLKLQEDFNYTFLCQSTPTNHWRHWKTRDVMVWSQIKMALNIIISKESL